MSNALPVVPMPKHRAIAWPVSDRLALLAALEPFGVSLTELSDTREACGLPRLSSTEPSVRWAAPHLLRSARGRAALAAVRARRALYVEALAQSQRDDVARARHLLGLRRSTPSALRLSELAALVAQVRALEILAEQAERLALAA